MINELYKNDRKENLKIFSDLKRLKEYSNKSKELNSKFNAFTYAKFLENLKNYNKRKSININSFYSISSHTNKNKRQQFQEFDISKIKASIERMKKKENSLKEKREHPYTERCLYSNPVYTFIKNKTRQKAEEMKLIKKEKLKNSNTPEIGRYNPIYEAINKHTQQVIFSPKNFEEYNNSFRQEAKYNKILIEKEKYNKRNKTNKAYNKKGNKTMPILINDNEYKLNVDKSEELKNKNKANNLFYNTAITKKEKKIIGRNIDKNNHCLRFDTYCPRKPIINKIFYRTENTFQIPSFCSPKTAKGNIEFDKISSNKFYKNYFEKIINQKKEVPALGVYRPNYTFVTNKTTNYFFDGNKNDTNNAKYMKLKKILGSYSVRGEYKLFDFLNDNGDLSQ